MRDFNIAVIFFGQIIDKTHFTYSTVLYNNHIRNYTVKKMIASFPSPAGMSLPNSPWAGIMTSLLNYSWPGGVWLVTSRLETGNS